MDDELIRFERSDRVAIIRLHRPEALNALSLPLREALRRTLMAIDADESIGAAVITGDEKAFAAGADIRVMRDWNRQDAETRPELRGAWEQLCGGRVPVIAAVAGFALGAGCELAMMCDFIIAADNARFGQPEIKLGTIPGSGGTQRLTRLVGRAKAMEMILTGRLIDAHEAERCGLVARVVPLASLMDEAVKAATVIAELSPPVVRFARDAVNHALETPLAEGLRYEQRLFEETFTLEDRREGMTAFIEKRKPVFRSR
jgi:enoyl-CoA hydratase